MSGITRTEDIERTEALINMQLDKIAELLMEHGIISSPKELKLRVGTEVEFNTVAGKESAQKRFEMMSQSGVRSEGKRDSYMPKKAQHAGLNELFGGGKKGVRVDMEPDIRMQVGVEHGLGQREDGSTFERKPEMVAFSQKELVCPPLNSVGAARWLDIVYERLIQSAEGVGLKRISLATRPHQETTSSSIHLNTSLFAGGEDLLSAQTFGSGEEKDLSELALCVGHACNANVRDAFPVFAPSRSCYVRFTDAELLGPKSIRVGNRKERGNYPTAIFRGAGRVCGRVEDGVSGNNADSGPLRLEVRVAGPEAAGHPNRTAYPELAVMAYELIEANIRIFADGLEMWSERQIARAAGEDVEPLSEEKLLAERFKIPLSLEEAERIMTKSLKMAENYYGRRHGMSARREKLSKIVDMDHSPNVVKRGAIVDRSKELVDFAERVENERKSDYAKAAPERP